MAASHETKGREMRRMLIALGLAAAALALAVGALAHEDDGDGILKDERHFREQSQKEYTGGNKAGSALNMVAVGQNNLDARGFNADVWVHEKHA